MKRIFQLILAVVFAVVICAQGFAVEKIVIEGSGDN